MPYKKKFYKKSRIKKSIIKNSVIKKITDPPNYCEIRNNDSFTHEGLYGAAQGGENDLRRWWGSVEYITSRKKTVRLGSLLGLYERFPIKK